MHIRLATIADAEVIRTIYNVEVTETTHTFDMVPRTLVEQQEWLTSRLGALTVLVAEDAGEVVGFASLSSYRDRPAYRTTVEDSVYVARSHQGQGVGKLLLNAVVVAARSRGFHTIMARIVDGHEASIQLHRSVGFELVGVEREVGRKFHRWLDVALMQRMLRS